MDAIGKKRLPTMDETAGPPTCLFCGQTEHVAIHEVWGHEWMFETCCEALHEQLAIEMADDPAWARQFMRQLDVEALCGNRLRRIADDGGCGLVLDWALEIRPIEWAAARAFVAHHHAHCRPPVTWRFQTAVYNGRTLLGVALVGNPVARALNRRGIVEVNRLCIRRDTPEALRWNAASMLYGWCAREAARLGWRKIITYTRADEPGTSLVAAGWTRDGPVRGRGWHSARRARSNTNSWIGKVRWSRQIAPAEQRSISRAGGSDQRRGLVTAGGPDVTGTSADETGNWTLEPISVGACNLGRTAAPSSSSPL